MKPVLIDINDYILSGKGVTGNTYDSKISPDTIVKLYDTVYPKEAIYAELEAAKKVYDMGIPSPEPGVLVTDGVRLGMQFKKILNKRSYSQAVSEEPERCEEFAREFARVNKKLHSMILPKDTFPDSKKIFHDTVVKHPYFTDDEKSVILKFVESIPDACNALHGDLHMGNVISTLSKGTPLSEPHDIFFIDLGYFSQGYPLIDLSINDVVCNYIDESLRTEHYHLPLEKTQKFWKYFVDEYFFGEDMLVKKYLGENADRKDVDTMLYQFTALRLCLVSYVLGKMTPEFETVIRKGFGL